MPSSLPVQPGASAAPLVSVVIPSFRAQDYIAATVRSVLAQSHANLEVIVVDDRSPDGTADIVEEIGREDPRTRCIRLEKNFGGPAGPRNIGVREARGEWIAFLDADDIWHPDKLAVQLKALAASGKRFCSSKMMDFEDEKDLVFTPAEGCPTREISFLNILVKSRIPASSVLVAADLVRRHPFNEEHDYKAREDMDCWLRCHEEAGPSIKILHPLIGYRVSPNQISRSKMLMLKRHYHILSNYRTRSGRRLGAVPGAFFTFTHILLSAWYRLVLREL
jgi:teichuronic acid biosynthesis glycosyltransferase TuaG